MISSTTETHTYIQTMKLSLKKALKKTYCFRAGELGEQLLLQVQFPVLTTMEFPAPVLMPSPVLLRHQEHMKYIHIHSGKTYHKIKENINKKFKEVVLI